MRNRSPRESPMIQRIAGFLTHVVHRVLPDSLIFAILLNVATPCRWR